MNCSSSESTQTSDHAMSQLPLHSLRCVSLPSVQAEVHVPHNFPKPTVHQYTRLSDRRDNLPFSFSMTAEEMPAE